MGASQHWKRAVALALLIGVVAVTLRQTLDGAVVSSTRFCMTRSPGPDGARRSWPTRSVASTWRSGIAAGRAGSMPRTASSPLRRRHRAAQPVDGWSTSGA